MPRLSRNAWSLCSAAASRRSADATSASLSASLISAVTFFSAKSVRFEGAEVAGILCHVVRGVGIGLRGFEMRHIGVGTDERFVGVAAMVLNFLQFIFGLLGKVGGLGIVAARRRILLQRLSQTPSKIAVIFIVVSVEFTTDPANRQFQFQLHQLHPWKCRQNRGPRQGLSTGRPCLSLHAVLCRKKSRQTPTALASLRTRLSPEPSARVRQPEK